MTDSFNLVVIGSGPGGQRAAVQAAKLGKRVMIVEKSRFGGSSLHLGTIPSKTLREAVLSLAKGSVDVLASALQKTREVVSAEMTVISEQLKRNSIETVIGTASFESAHQIKLTLPGGRTRHVQAETIVLATGTRPRAPSGFRIDARTCFDSDSILSLDTRPKNLCVMGAGVIGCEYASIFAHMGCRVTVLDRRTDLLRGVDREIVSRLKSELESRGVTFELGTTFSDPRLEGPAAVVDIAGRAERFEAILFCMGRIGNIEELELHKAGLSADSRGLLEVNSSYQTQVPHIYAVGDLIGPPALAASASEQGRLAACHAFGAPSPGFPKLFPYGIYTIPEISSVGAEESSLQEGNIPYVVGRARFCELARGKILGDEHGLLKLLFHKETRALLGAHIIGSQATELVHIGQIALSFGAKIDDLIPLVFNYPTLAEAYKVACLNALNQLRSEASPTP